MCFVLCSVSFIFSGIKKKTKNKEKKKKKKEEGGATTQQSTMIRTAKDKQQEIGRRISEARHPLFVSSKPFPLLFMH